MDLSTKEVMYRNHWKNFNPSLDQYAVTIRSCHSEFIEESGQERSFANAQDDKVLVFNKDSERRLILYEVAI